MKVLNIVTTPQSLSFIKNHPRVCKEHGIEMHAVSSQGPALNSFGKIENVPVHAVSMRRKISPFRDLVAICQLYKLFLIERPDIVHAHTPKASLVSLIAGWLARVPGLIFHVHGLPHTTASGFERLLLKWSTKIPSLLASRILCVSHSARELAVNEGLCCARKIVVLGKGSSNGVDSQNRFCPAKFNSSIRQELFGLDHTHLVIGFAGRLVRDKGVSELHSAWTRIREEFPNAHLLIAGVPEERDALPLDVLQALRSDPRVRMLGHVKDMPSFYACLDVFVLPTYREGLPTVILESAAMAVPSVATRAVGCVDAVVDGDTGILVPVGDSAALADAICTYLRNPDLRERHGSAARARVLQDFRPEDIWHSILQEYEQLSLNSELSLRLRALFESAMKRVFDISVSALALLFLAPLIAVLAGLVRLCMGSPAFFCQARPGLHGRLFRMFKLRTMRDAVGADGQPLPDGERLTSLGCFLRATSLDELPELWNVLKGDMSLVGPRPLLPQYLPRYTTFQRRRHEAKPGVTGWAQVNGRNSLTWEQKFDLDVWYVDHQSFGLDLRILLATVLAVASGSGISKPGHATEQEFRGTPDPA